MLLSIFGKRLLFLQLRRYIQSRGAILKSGVPVAIAAGEIIWMPLWDDGVELSYEPYEVTTAVSSGSHCPSRSLSSFLELQCP